MTSRTLRRLASRVGCLWNRGFHLRAEFGCDVRIQAKPCLPRRAHLMQQHPQSVHRGIAATACRRQQWCLYWHIDDVADERCGWKLVEGKVERRLSDHALARRVDEHRGVVESHVPVC